MRSSACLTALYHHSWHQVQSPEDLFMTLMQHILEHDSALNKGHVKHRQAELALHAF